MGAGAQTAVQAAIKVQYVLYARKSTESEEKQVLSIDSQVKEMLQLAERDGLEIIDIRRESIPVHGFRMQNSNSANQTAWHISWQTMADS